MRGVPKLLRRKADGLAYSTWRQAGRKRFRYFGKFGSAEARAAYARFVREYEAAHRPVGPPAVRPGLLVAELVAAHLHFAQDYYRRPDGTKTTEPDEFNCAYRPLVRLFAGLRAADFRPGHFKAVRDAMVAAGLARTTVNQRMGRVRRLWRWAAAEDLVEPAVAHALAAVPDLAPGRSSARDDPPVAAVAWELVEATLPHLPSDRWRDLVRFHWWAGCRPGEALRVRGADLFSGWVEVTGHQLPVPPGVLAYRVRAKMAHARQSKYQIYALGPQAQETLKPWLGPDPAAYCFSKDPTRHHLTSSYEHAVKRACKKAGLEPWHPNQIRHAAEQRVEKAFGIEAARQVLGHQSIHTSLLYSDRDLAGAALVALRIG